MTFRIAVVIAVVLVTIYIFAAMASFHGWFD